MQRQLTTTESRKYIQSGDYMSAFARTSADLEMILFEKLFLEKGIKPELMERWSLSMFIQWNIKLGFIEQKWGRLLTDFRKLRNKVIHGRVFLIRLMQNQEEIEKVKNLLLAVCDFIDQTVITYKSTPKIEKEYSNLDRD